MVFGAAIGGFAALGAMRLGETFGSFLPIAAAAFGALAGRVFFSTLTRKTGGAARSSVSHESGDGASDEGDTSQPSDASGPSGSTVAEVSTLSDIPDRPSPPQPPEPEWPVETHEVQVKLDLARSYVELGDPELAVQYLQEVLELETAIGRKLSSEVLRETREQAPENAAVGLPD
jgi:FimV-like protein